MSSRPSLQALISGENRGEPAERIAGPAALGATWLSLLAVGATRIWA